MSGKKRLNFFKIREAPLYKSVSGFEKHIIKGFWVRHMERIVERIGNGLFNQRRCNPGSCISSFAGSCFSAVVIHRGRFKSFVDASQNFLRIHADGGFFRPYRGVVFSAAKRLQSFRNWDGNERWSNDDAVTRCFFRMFC